MNRIPSLVAVALILALAAPAIGQTSAPRPQIAVGESFTVTAEVVKFDPASRKITLKGPLGGEIVGAVAETVKDVSQLQPGALVSVTYYQAIAASARRTGDSRPLFTAEQAAAKRQPGLPASSKSATTQTLTVSSVALDSNTVVFQRADGTLLPTEVNRPEFRAKLKDLRSGDQIDVTYSEALVTGITPVAPGQEAKATMKLGTLVIDRGEVVRRMDETLLIRNERGRMIRVKVDPNFKFLVDGKEMTVYDLREGTKLSRTALRVREVSYPE